LKVVQNRGQRGGGEKAQSEIVSIFVEKKGGSFLCFEFTTTFRKDAARKWRPESKQKRKIEQLRGKRERREVKLDRKKGKDG